MNIKKALGKRIKEIRVSLGLTQEEVAEKIEINPSSYCNIENGKYYPTAENLDKILLALNISPSEIFEFEHLQDNDDLIEEINNMLRDNPEKVSEIYKVIKAIV